MNIPRDPTPKKIMSGRWDTEQPYLSKFPPPQQQQQLSQF